MEKINQVQGNNLYIKNLEESIDDIRLRQEFESYGTITSAKVMRDEKGNSKGFGFVCFQSPEEATKAVTEKNGQILLMKPLYVALAQRCNHQGVNLYIKNLEESIDDTRLRQEFESYGTITSAKVMRDEKGNSKGFGFVCFQSPEEATKAVTEKNGQIVLTKPLYVALAQRKEERQAQLAAKRMQHVAGRVIIPQGTQPFPGAFYPMATFPAGQRPPLYPPQAVVRTRFPTQPVQGQPGYPQMMVGNGRGVGSMGPMPPQHVGQAQGAPTHTNQYHPHHPQVNQLGGAPQAVANASGTQGIAISRQDILDQNQMLG